jgi:hypothetical protein
MLSRLNVEQSDSSGQTWLRPERDRTILPRPVGPVMPIIVAGYFHKIFGESPVLPVQEHCSLCYQAADAMLDMLRHAAAGDWVKAEEGRARVVGFELRADRLKREVRGKLPGGMFMPVAREDLLELIIVEDKIANRARDISGLVFGRKMTIPEPIRDSFLGYYERNPASSIIARNYRCGY